MTQELVSARSPTMRLNANTLFNGVLSRAHLNHVQNSHATPAPRRILAVEWTAYAAPYCPPSEAGGRRPIFLERREIAAPLAAAIVHMPRPRGSDRLFFFLPVSRALHFVRPVDLPHPAAQFGQPTQRF
jgi:hypothetical protein